MFVLRKAIIYIGEKVKKNQDDIVYVIFEVSTPCDAETPHFSIKAKELKLYQTKKIITGPAITEFSSVPTPLAIPFGFFPNQKKQVQVSSFHFMENLPIKDSFIRKWRLLLYY